MVLKGHHRSSQSGVSIGQNGSVACLVVKYTSHNFAALPLVIVGGSGGHIKEAYRVRQRLLRDQELTTYNLAFELSVQNGMPLRLYAHLPDPVTGEFWYRYLGLFRVNRGEQLQTDEGYNCYQYTIQQLGNPGQGGFPQLPPPLGLQGPDLQDPDGIFLGGPDPAVGEQGYAYEEVIPDPEIWHGQQQLESNAVVVNDSSKKNFFMTWKIHKRKRSEKVYYDFPLKIHKRKRSRVTYNDFPSSSMLDYIHTSHPNFIGGSKAVELALQEMKSFSSFRAADSTIARHEDGSEKAPSSERSLKSRAILSRQANDIILQQGARPATESTAPGSTTGSSWGISSFLGGPDNCVAAKENLTSKPFNEPIQTIEPSFSMIHLGEPRTVLRPSDTNSEQEAVEIIVTRKQLTSYYDIVRKNIEDFVPKTIMHFLCPKDVDAFFRFYPSAEAHQEDSVDE